MKSVFLNKMTNIQAKQLINLLSKKWKIGNKKFLLEIISFLDRSIDKRTSFFNGFEFSFVEDKPKIRLLHLYFWQSNLSINAIKNIIRKREETIISVFKQLNIRFNCRYDFNLGNKFFEFNRQNGFWPIQFGLEYQKNFLPKIKVYLSVNDSFPFKKFCNNFNLKYLILKRVFKNRKFDAVAIDFLPKGEFEFKFYPVFKKNKGLLYRVNKNSEIYSKKIWRRFPKGLTIEAIENSNFIKLPFFIRNHIIKNKFKISYICQENDKKSIYFR